MRHLVLHLRKFLFHDLGRLALDPRAYTELFKVGAFKAGGAVTAGLLIPVTALATYSIPAGAIERITAPLVSAAPDIFDVRSLGKLSQARLRDIVQAPGSVRRALGGPTDTFDPGSSDQSLVPVDVLSADGPDLLGAGSAVDQLAPAEATGDDADPGTSDGPAPDAGSGAGGSVLGPHDPDPTTDDVTGEGDDGDQDEEASGDSTPGEEPDPVDDQQADHGGDAAGDPENEDQTVPEPGGTATDAAQGGPNPEDSGNTGQSEVGDGTEDAPIEDQAGDQGDQVGDEDTGDDQGDQGEEDQGDDGTDTGNGNNGNGNGNGGGNGTGNEGNGGGNGNGNDDEDEDDHNGDGHADNGHGHG